MNFVPHFNFFGVDAKQIPCIVGEGAPTAETEGAVGCFYMDTLTGKVYKCVSDNNGGCAWVDTEDFVDYISANSNTPVVLGQNNTKEVKLLGAADTEYSYSVLSETIRSYKDATITAVNYTEQPYLYGKSYVKNADAPSAWSSSYIELVFDNLCGGMEYVICIDSRKAGTEFNTMYVVLYDNVYNVINSPSDSSYYWNYNQDNGWSLNFIMPEGKTKLNVRLYRGGKITFDNIYINRANSDGKYHTDRAEVYGTFTGEHIISAPQKGCEISTTPECNAEIIINRANTQSVNGYTPDKNGNIRVPASRFSGKKMVCFGDSITGNYSAPTDYPSVIAEMTGMTVYNCGFGGCRMAIHSLVNFDAFSMCRLADAIVSGDFTVQDNAVAAGADIANLQEHLNTLKTMDWASVDYISIAYGTNDIQGGVGIDNAEIALNRNTYIGAFRYSIKKIMTAYPHIKILVMTPMYRFYTDTGEDSDSTLYGGDKHFVDWVDALIEASKEMKLPCIDMYRTLCINKYNRGLYFPYNDGTHPNSIGRKVIGEKVAARMSAEF